MGIATNDEHRNADPERRANPGSCWDCGYSLRGLAAAGIRRCPDCGRAFDPDQPRSVNRRRRPLGFIAKRALFPPGWPTARLAALAAAMVAWGTGSVTGFHIQLDDWPLLRRTLTSRDVWTTYS